MVELPFGVLDVVIVGAGMAGLVCARELARHGAEVVVLEARDRVGGRAHGVELAGTTVELGGQFLGAGQDRCRALAAELGVRIFPTACAGKHLFEPAAGAPRRYRGTVPRLSGLTLLDVGRAMRRFEALARTVDVDAPWRGPDAARLDGQTLETWIGRTLWTRPGRQLFTLACEAAWSCEPAELALLHALFYARAAGGFEALLAVEGGAQQDRIEGGAHGLAARLAGPLGDRVRLGAYVRRVVQRGGEVAVTTQDGRTWLGRRAVIALPPPLACRIDYVPPMPAARDSLLQRLPMGSVVKCLTVYPAPFWRAAGLSGHAVSLRGPVSAVLDSSPRLGERGILLGFVEGDAAREFARRPAAERRSLVLGEFRRLFGDTAADPLAYVEQDWGGEPFSRGAYAAVFPPGAWTRLGHALRPPFGRVHWAGTETSRHWYGYLEGAVRSGETTAAEIRPLL